MTAAAAYPAATAVAVVCAPAAFKAQLSDRRFQAGFKAWLASTIAIVVIAASYTQLGFLGVSVRPVCCGQCLGTSGQQGLRGAADWVRDHSLLSSPVGMACIYCTGLACFGVILLLWHHALMTNVYL
jgi:hypothetical protein